MKWRLDKSTGRWRSKEVYIIWVIVKPPKFLWKINLLCDLQEENVNTFEVIS